MAKHIVKCSICNNQFDANEEPYIKTSNGRRYAHKECAEKQELKKGVIEKIHTKMSSLLGYTYNRTKIDRQIKNMLKDGKTEIGIFRTLEYWYDIKQNSTEKAAGGIGIVDWVYGDAMNYYDRQERYKRQAILNNVPIEEKEIRTIKIKPTPIRKPKGIKLFQLD